MNRIALKTRTALGVIGAVALMATTGALVRWAVNDRIRPNRTFEARYFSRADSWTALGGAWNATANEIENSSRERGSKLVSRDAPWRDIQIDADLRLEDSFAEAGLLFRAVGAEEGVDAYHGYFAGVRRTDGSIELGRADFGWHPLARASLPEDVDLSGWIHLHVVAVGCSLGLQVTSGQNKPAALLVHDVDCIQEGAFGLRSSFASAIWRNLRVSTATIVDLKAVEAIASQTAMDHDRQPYEPSAAEGMKRALDAMKAVAEERNSQPGVTPIARYRLSPGLHPNVTIQGSVISLPPFADIQDSTGTIMLPNLDPALRLRLGDVVAARGDLVVDRFRSRLDHAKVRILWSETPYPPLAVTAAQLTNGTYRGRLIEVDGTLESAHPTPSGYELILKDGHQTFVASGQINLQLDIAALRPKSRLRIRGNATSLDQFTHGIYPFAVVADSVRVIGAPPWWSPRHIVWLILIVIAILLSLQWALHRAQAWHVRLLLREREELAFEMHDTLAQNFTGIAYQLQAAAMETRGPAEMRQQVANALKMVNMSHREASRTIAALRPQYRQASDIVDALRDLAERLSDGGGLDIKATMEGKNIELPLAVTDALFRVGQEGVTNAIQHANCRSLGILLGLARDEVRLVIQDNGQGTSSEAQSLGLGIAGMRSRAAKVHGRFEFLTTPSAGTTIKVTIPLSRAHGLLSFCGRLLGLSSAREPIHTQP